MDIDSSLNMILKNTLSQLLVRREEMRPISFVVRAFEVFRRQLIGEVDLAIRVGPHSFTITFKVMDINPTYNCLLGRPWIHVVGVVTSTLHQKLKFMFEDKLVIVSGEEDFLINELSSFRYVETKEGITEVPFHFLE